MTMDNSTDRRVLFQTLLDEKSINPLLPWDTSLPLIIRDSRYLLLPSLSLRKEVFDEWCRDTIREAKEAKVREEREKGEQGHIPGMLVHYSLCLGLS